jgi:hypothetical protein
MKRFQVFLLTFVLYSSVQIFAARQKPESRTIKVQTPSGAMMPCSADETPEMLFRQCRQQRNCSGDQLTLLFVTFEIKEGSQAAKKQFNQFETRLCEAFVVQAPEREQAVARERNNNRNNNNEPVLGVVVKQSGQQGYSALSVIAAFFAGMFVRNQSGH